MPKDHDHHAHIDDDLKYAREYLHAEQHPVIPDRVNIELLHGGLGMLLWTHLESYQSIIDGTQNHCLEEKYGSLQVVAHELEGEKPVLGLNNREVELSRDCF